MNSKKCSLSANEWVCGIHRSTQRQTSQNASAQKQVNRRAKAPSGYLGHKGWWSTNLIWLGKPNRSKWIEYRVYWRPLTGLLRDKEGNRHWHCYSNHRKIVHFQSHLRRRTSTAHRVERVMVLRCLLLPHKTAMMYFWRSSALQWKAIVLHRIQWYTQSNLYKHTHINTNI